MSVSSPIADMFSILRNALELGYEKASVPHSNFKEDILKVMEKEGFLEKVETEKQESDPQGNIKVYFKYTDEGKNVMEDVEMVSEPGRRVYRDKDNIPYVLSGIGVSIVSTSRGVMSDNECRERGIGGEIICRVW